jgi:hypothetical protein
MAIADEYGLLPFISEFNNFLNAKGKKKFKIGSLKKGLKKLGGQIKSVGQAIGKGLAKVVIALPRTAFLSLLDLNCIVLENTKHNGKSSIKQRKSRFKEKMGKIMWKI